MIINDLRGRVTRPRGNCNRELYFPVMGSYPMDNCTYDANKHTNLCQFLPRSSDCAGCPSYPLPRWFSQVVRLPVPRGEIISGHEAVIIIEARLLVMP